MPETDTNRGYLETDIDEILDDTSAKSNSLPNVGSIRQSSNQNNGIEIKTSPENSVPEVTSKTPFLGTASNQGGATRTDNGVFSSNKDERQTNPTEENISSKSPLLQASPLEAPDDTNESGRTDMVTKTPRFPQYRHIAAVIIFLPLGWFAYKKAKEAYEEQPKTDHKKRQRRREFAEGLTTLSIWLGVAMIFLLLFLLVTRLVSLYWQPGNLAKFCHNIQSAGYTSRACPKINIG